MTTPQDIIAIATNKPRLNTTRSLFWIFAGPQAAIKSSYGHNLVDAMNGHKRHTVVPFSHRLPELNRFMATWFERYAGTTLFNNYDELATDLTEVALVSGCTKKQADTIIEAWRLANILTPVEHLAR